MYSDAKSYTEAAQRCSNITLDQFQMWCEMYRKWPTCRRVEYPVMGLAGEAGEVANKVKKVMRNLPENHEGNIGAVITESQVNDIIDEVMDCAYYVVATLSDLGITFEQAFLYYNLPKLAGRHHKVGDILPTDFPHNTTFV